MQRRPQPAWWRLPPRVAEAARIQVAIALLRLLRLLVEQAPLALKPHAPRLLPPLGALLAGAMAVSDARMAAQVPPSAPPLCTAPLHPRCPLSARSLHALFAASCTTSSPL